MTEVNLNDWISTRRSECGEWWIARIKQGDYANLQSWAKHRQTAIKSVWTTYQEWMERFK